MSLLADGVQSDNSQNLLGRLALPPHVTPLFGANVEANLVRQSGVYCSAGSRGCMAAAWLKVARHLAEMMLAFEELLTEAG